MDSDGIFAETFMDRIERFVEITTDLVDFVDETDTRDTIFSGLAPNSFGLSFDTHLTIKDNYGTIKHAQRTLNFSGEVDVSRGINDVDLMIFPINSNSSGSDSDTTFLFLFHPVSFGATSVAFD